MNTNTNTPTLYIIQGFIASGKSTFSRTLSAETNAVILNPDEWVEKLYSVEEYTSNWNSCFDNTVTMLWSKAKEYLVNNTSVIFDMGFWYKKDRDFAKNFAKDNNAHFVHYYLDVPEHILKERIIKDRPPKWAKIHLDNFDKNLKLFEKPTKNEKHIVIKNY